MRMTPSEYFQRQCWVSCEPDERELPHAIEVLGAEKIVFATDYHHFDAVFPGVVAKLADRTDLSEDVKDVLFERGARALLNLAPAETAPATASAAAAPSR
jgi:predicted TIM-barrel fold metal-dependent hydrolase